MRLPFFPPLHEFTKSHPEPVSFILHLLLFHSQKCYDLPFRFLEGAGSTFPQQQGHLWDVLLEDERPSADWISLLHNLCINSRPCDFKPRLPWKRIKASQPQQTTCELTKWINMIVCLFSSDYSFQGTHNWTVRRSSRFLRSPKTESKHIISGDVCYPGVFEGLLYYHFCTRDV